MRLGTRQLCGEHARPDAILIPKSGPIFHRQLAPFCSGIDNPEGFEVKGLFNPVWVIGTITAEGSVQNVGYIDGQAPVSVSYTMKPEKVLPF